MQFRISYDAPRSVSVISVKAPTELKQDIYTNWMPLTAYHQELYKIDHNYHKLLRILIFNIENNTLQIPRKTVIGKLKPIDVTDSEVSNISWTTDGTTTMNKPTGLPCMPSELSFQLEHNINKHSIVLEDAHILQEAKDGLLSSLLEGEYNRIISKSPADLGRTNLFQMDDPSTGPPVACKHIQFH